MKPVQHQDAPMKKYQVFFSVPSERGIQSFTSRIFKAETEEQAEELFLQQTGRPKDCIQKVKMISAA
ncbi:hypothetical protein [Kistimonas asteriae]|uniref:hypothetical protein n=1 Tax=Kistimonas asteriae TaxID=517724 RepID=UPI001BA4A863|nr:hypothetical protein [Kistimonas asteriae]